MVIKMDVLSKYQIDKDNYLIKRAFTHSSYVNENKSLEDYERLEFLGDKILDFLVSEYLYTSDHLKEGQMTKIRASFVCENALSDYSKKLGFDNYILLGNGERKTWNDGKKAILADCFEAFLAAVYLVYGLEKVRNIVNDVVISAIKNHEDFYLNDYKSKLQELLQSDKKGAEYIIENEEGPSNEKVFTSIVVMDGVILGRGTANSKKESEQLAAKDALSKQPTFTKENL